MARACSLPAKYGISVWGGGPGRREGQLTAASCSTAVRKRSHARIFSGRRPTSNNHATASSTNDPYVCQLPCTGPSHCRQSNLRRLFLQDRSKAAPATALGRTSNDLKPGDNGRRNAVHAGDQLPLPPPILLQIRIVVHTPNITASTSQICDCPPCDIPEPTVHPIITRRDMGGYSQGCAKEKDVAFEEET